MSSDLLRRGFKFVGSTICYAFMQAVGLVNDHTRRLLPACASEQVEAVGTAAVPHSGRKPPDRLTGDEIG